MKSIAAIVIAAVVLWIVDANFNSGRYAIAIVRLARPVLAQIGIHI
jgi:hypothetical protein